MGSASFQVEVGGRGIELIDGLFLLRMLPLLFGSRLLSLIDLVSISFNNNTIITMLRIARDVCVFQSTDCINYRV